MAVDRSGTTRTAGDIPVSVVIPVKDEESNLPRCLAALSRFAEVIVVDSGSTDKTQDIAREEGVTFIGFQWDGRYPKKRNWVLINQQLANEWVLFLDADELVSDRFCSEVAVAIESGLHNGYWLNYTNYFLGRRLKHGVRQRKLALFRVGMGYYERVDEDCWSTLDMEVHEHPIIDGSIGEVNEPIEHKDLGGVEKFLNRHLNYARWEARRAFLFENSERDVSYFTRRQRFKYRNIEKWWYPWLYFFYAYLVRGGALDGGVGLQYAFYKSWYFLTVRLMLQELREQSNGDTPAER